MSTNQNKISLLRYWTTRYLVTLCIGLLIIAFISILWIRHTNLENRLNLTQFLAEEAADRVVDSNGTILQGRFFSVYLEERQKLLNMDSKPFTFIVNQYGTILYSDPNQNQYQRFSLSLLQDPESIQEVTLGEGEIYVVKAPIEFEGQVLGWVVVLQAKGELTKTNQEYNLLAILLISLALLGWLVIYFLSQRIARPIHLVADAANQIKTGNYNVELPTNAKEKEVAELIASFKDMSEKLDQLEALRAELLAGITHELKTPVTSISSLTQAIKDEVVTGEEAKEFLDISLKETNRLQKMIQDLLDFNSFSAGSISIKKEEIHFQEFIQDVTHQWSVIRDYPESKLYVKLPSTSLWMKTDPLRVEQVLLNLLNNAQDSLQGDGFISLEVNVHSDKVIISVADTGIGVPLNEQELIFERFYRGEQKKHKVRGLGLGLPFSKMIVKALGGDLYLKESSSRGTVMCLELPLLK
ncbi:ATP-binding protein [Bacillaceae bacterium S4-13-58]